MVCSFVVLAAFASGEAYLARFSRR